MDDQLLQKILSVIVVVGGFGMIYMSTQVSENLSQTFTGIGALLVIIGVIFSFVSLSDN